LKPRKRISRPNCLLKQVGLSVFAAQLLEGEGIVSACFCYCTNSHSRRLDADPTAAEFVVWNAYYLTRLLRAVTLSAGLNRVLDAHIIKQAIDVGVYHSPTPPQFDCCRCRRVALRSRVVSPQHYQYSNQ